MDNLDNNFTSYHTNFQEKSPQYPYNVEYIKTRPEEFAGEYPELFPQQEPSPQSYPLNDRNIQQYPLPQDQGIIGDWNNSSPIPYNPLKDRNIQQFHLPQDQEVTGNVNGDGNNPPPYPYSDIPPPSNYPELHQNFPSYQQNSEYQTNSEILNFLNEQFSPQDVTSKGVEVKSEASTPPTYQEHIETHNQSFQYVPLPVLPEEEDVVWEGPYAQGLKIIPDKIAGQRVIFLNGVVKSVLEQINNDIDEEQKRPFYDIGSSFNIFFLDFGHKNKQDEGDTMFRVAATIIFVAICVIGVGSIVKEIGNLSRAENYMRILVAQDFEINAIEQKKFLEDQVLKERVVNLFIEPGQALSAARWESFKRIIIKVATVVGAVLGAIGAICAAEAIFSVGLLLLGVGGLAWTLNNIFFDNYKTILLNSLHHLENESESLRQMIG